MTGLKTEKWRALRGDISICRRLFGHTRNSLIFEDIFFTVQPSVIILNYGIIHISTMNRHLTEYLIGSLDIASLRICHAGKQIQCIAIMSLVLDMKKKILPTTVFQLGMKNFFAEWGNDFSTHYFEK